MKMRNSLILVLLFILFKSFGSDFKRIAYIPSYRMQYLGEINFDLVSHVMAAFANPDDAGNLSFSNYDMHDFVSIAHSNNTDAIISIGGGGDYSWGDKVSIYQNLFATQESRKDFIHNIMTYMRTYNFDGLDNDIEGNALALDNFNSFTQELGDSLHAAGYDYSAAIGVGGSWGVNYWDDESLEKLDFIMTMSYGGVGNWNYALKTDDHTFDKMKTDMEYFTITKSISPEKIIGGIPFYAVEFPSTAKENYGPYHQTVCSIYNNSYYDNQNPFHSDTLTSEEGNPVYINSIETIQKKIDYCASDGGGIMIWEIGQDCFDGSISVQDSMNAYLQENKVNIKSISAAEITVFPNPADNIIRVSSPLKLRLNYSVVNYLGQTILSGLISNSDYIDVSALKPGIYYLELKDQKHNFNREEIVKKH